MQRFTDLEQLLAHIWQQIKQGAEDPSHPYHAPTLGTVGEAGASLRTVILREVDIGARSLLLHSDRRARKISEIQTNPQITWHCWNPARNEQLRLKGNATLHFEDELAERIWQNSSPGSLKLYVKSMPPGTAVNSPQSGLPTPIQSGKLTKDDVAAGRQFFAVVFTRIDEIDFLQLHHEGNYRARFQWHEDQVSSCWMIP